MRYIFFFFGDRIVIFEKERKAFVVSRRCLVCPAPVVDETAAARSPACICLSGVCSSRAQRTRHGRGGRCPIVQTNHPGTDARVQARSRVGQTGRFSGRVLQSSLVGCDSPQAAHLCSFQDRCSAAARTRGETSLKQR